MLGDLPNGESPASLFAMKEKLDQVERLTSELPLLSELWGGGDPKKGQHPILRVKVPGPKEVKGFIDTLASESFLSKRLLDTLPKQAFRRVKRRECFQVGVGPGFCADAIEMKIMLKPRGGPWKKVNILLFVADVNSIDLVLGVPFLDAYGIQVSFSGDGPRVSCQLEGEALILETSAPLQPCSCLHMLNRLQQRDPSVLVSIITPMPLKESEEDGIHGEDDVVLTSQQQQALDALLLRYADVFKPHEAPPRERVPGESARMTLKEYTDDGERVRPKSRAPYPISRRAREGAKEKIDSWVQRGLLKPSNSPWGSPLVAVAKVDSEGNVTGTRVTLDMRWVNKCVLRDHFPLRRLEDLLSRFGRFKVYSGVDLYDGFTQLPLHPDSQDLSAIVTPWGVYNWTVLPQGLANGPSEFQRFTERVFGYGAGLDWMTAYLDDVLIGAEDIPEMLERIELLLKRCRKENIRLKPSKCFWLKRQVHFLGHALRHGEVETLNKHLVKIKAFPLPSRAGEVSQFLGLCNWYAKFVPKYSELAGVLTPYQASSKTKRHAEVALSEEAQAAFHRLKAVMASPMVLATFDPERWHRVRTDASYDHGSGAVLEQWHHGEAPVNPADLSPEAELGPHVEEPKPRVDLRGTPAAQAVQDVHLPALDEHAEVAAAPGTAGHDDGMGSGRWRPVFFYSKKFSPAESNYSVGEKEMLAIVRALRAFRPWLLGERFYVQTDSTHCSYYATKDVEKLSEREKRWLTTVQEFAPLTIRYSEGILNVVADTLSRVESSFSGRRLTVVDLYAGSPTCLRGLEAWWHTDGIRQRVTSIEYQAVELDARRRVTIANVHRALLEKNIPLTTDPFSLGRHCDHNVDLIRGEYSWSRVMQQADLVLAGSPCQGWSRAPSKVPAGPHDERNGFETLVRLKEEGCLGKDFVLENVVFHPRWQHLEQQLADRLGCSLLTFHLGPQTRERRLFTTLPLTQEPISQRGTWSSQIAKAGQGGVGRRQFASTMCSLPNTHTERWRNGEPPTGWCQDARTGKLRPHTVEERETLAHLVPGDTDTKTPKASLRSRIAQLGGTIPASSYHWWLRTLMECRPKWRDDDDHEVLEASKSNTGTKMKTASKGNTGTKMKTKTKMNTESTKDAKNPAPDQEEKKMGIEIDPDGDLRVSKFPESSGVGVAVSDTSPVVDVRAGAVLDDAGQNPQWLASISSIDGTSLFERRVLRRLADFHEAQGHFGAAHTLNLWRRAVSRGKEAPLLDQDGVEVDDTTLRELFARVVKAFSHCQRRAPHRLVEGKVRILPYPVREYPFGDIQVDESTGWPRTTEGFEGFLTVVDRLTGHVLAVPTRRRETATSLCRKLHELFCLWGFPTKIWIDGDSRLSGELGQAYARIYNVDLNVGPAHHHQTQGLVERMQGLLKERILALLDQVRKETNFASVAEWDLVLPDALRLLNERPQEQKARLSANEMVLGRSIDEGAPTSLDEAWKKWREEYLAVVRVAHLRKHKQAEKKNEELTDHPRYRTRQDVMLRNLSPNMKKVDDRWLPFVVTKVLPHHTYLVRPVGGGPERSVHASDLKPAPKDLPVPPNEDEHREAPVGPTLEDIHRADRSHQDPVPVPASAEPTEDGALRPEPVVRRSRRARQRPVTYDPVDQAHKDREDQQDLRVRQELERQRRVEEDTGIIVHFLSFRRCRRRVSPSGHEVLVVFRDEHPKARWIPWTEELLDDAEDGGRGARSYLKEWGAVARSADNVPASLRALYGDGEDFQIHPWTYHGDPTQGKVATLRARSYTTYTRGLKTASRKWGVELALPDH